MRLVGVGSLTRHAIERAERYAAARDSWIEIVEGVQGGRPVIKGTRLAISAICGRLSSGDSVEDLLQDYPDLPRAALEAAFLYGKTSPQVGHPTARRAGRTG
jgi:uncharacterized protein (DUF433 family)